RIKGVFTENESAFMLANVLLTLEKLRKRKVVHRDLKLENLLMDSEGYLKVIDFGSSVCYKKPLNFVCGTKEYMSPEMLGGQFYDFKHDIWSLGILMCEFLMGNVPFDDDNDVKRLKMMKNNKIFISEKVSFSAKNLIKGLLNPNPKIRLDINQIKEHSFFEKTNFNQINKKKVPSPVLYLIKNKYFI
ncbi:hypothetical protein MHBO_004141, partial [Bonamia ostreae]